MYHVGAGLKIYRIIAFLYDVGLMIWVRQGRVQEKMLNINSEIARKT